MPKLKLSNLHQKAIAHGSHKGRPVKVKSGAVNKGIRKEQDYYWKKGPGKRVIDAAHLTGFDNPGVYETMTEIEKLTSELQEMDESDSKTQRENKLMNLKKGVDEWLNNMFGYNFDGTINRNVPGYWFQNDRTYEQLEQHVNAGEVILRTLGEHDNNKLVSDLKQVLSEYLDKLKEFMLSKKVDEDKSSDSDSGSDSDSELVWTMKSSALDGGSKQKRRKKSRKSRRNTLKKRPRKTLKKRPRKTLKKRSKRSKRSTK